MKKLIYLVLFLLCIAYNSSTTSLSLERGTPEAEGISKVILDFINAQKKKLMPYTVLWSLKTEKNEAELYNSGSPHELWSLVSFTSTATVLRLKKFASINDLVISFFPDKVPETTQVMESKIC